MAVLRMVLDLIDSNDVVTIVNGDGKVEMRGRVDSPLWVYLDHLQVENISAEGGEIMICLNDGKNTGPLKYYADNHPVELV